ncbi:MAG: CobW family GTP-binding protein [Pseudomonadota bacterium]
MSTPAGYPVTVIGGYLGAGKTTLVNHLLRAANGRRLAVLVNEFGDLAIDASLIEADDGDMISIAGGCICCSYGSDLMAALMELPQRLPDMDAVIVEASGVALPGGIVSALTLLPEYVLDAVVVLADAETIRTRASDRYLADTIRRQLTDADLILLNKMDLVGSAALQELRDWLGAEVPHARVVAASHANVPPQTLLGIGASSRVQAGDGTHFEADGFMTLSFNPDARFDLDALGEALAAPDSGVIRAKGFLLNVAGELCTLHVVGSRFAVSSAPNGAAPAFVCIGMSGVLEVEHVNELLAGPGAA